MQVTSILQVSEDEFHAFLQQMIKEDVSHTNGIEDLSEIKAGLQYQKEIRNRTQHQEHVNVSIDVLEKGRYEVSFESSQGKNIMAYSYKTVHQGEIEVNYEESFEGINPSTQISHKFFSMVTSKGNKKRLHQQLTQMETLIQSQR